MGKYQASQSLLGAPFDVSMKLAVVATSAIDRFDPDSIDSPYNTLKYLELYQTINVFTTGCLVPLVVSCHFSGIAITDEVDGGVTGFLSSHRDYSRRR